MTTLKVTARGCAALGKDVLEHLGVQPGGRMRVELLPNGRIGLSAEWPRSFDPLD